MEPNSKTVTPDTTPLVEFIPPVSSKEPSPVFVPPAPAPVKAPSPKAQPAKRKSDAMEEQPMYNDPESFDLDEPEDSLDKSAPASEEVDASKPRSSINLLEIPPMQQPSTISKVFAMQADGSKAPYVVIVICSSTIVIITPQ